MATRLTVLFSAAVLGASLAAAPAFAQARGGGRGFGGPGTMTLGTGGGQGGLGTRGARGGHRGGRGYSRGGDVYPYPYWYPYGGYDEGVAPAAQPEPPAPVVIVNRAAKPAPAPPSPPPESLLLEFRDGQWVRVPTGEKVPVGPLAAQPQTAPSPASNAGAERANQAPEARPKVRNVILVFRDGRREEIRKYVIQGSILYANEEYWKTGSWTKKIPLTELNVPATLEANRARGVRFDLPSGPSEVVVGF